MVLIETPAMDPDEFRDCLDAMGCSRRGLAMVLGIHHTRRERIATGRSPVLPEHSTWLRMLAGFHRAHAVPAGRRARG
jgi:hypothetical protein